MKKIRLILSVSLFWAVLGHAQTTVYHPFPDSPTWRVDYYYNNPWQFPCYIDYYFQYYTTGDTLINSTIYKKIYRSFVQVDTISCTTPMGIPETPTSGYVGALRDDTLNKKAVFVFPSSTTDSLLYDYNLAVGDSLRGIPASVNFFVSYRLIVTSKDSVLIDGQFRNRWNFNQPGHGSSPSIIEGIGSSCGLIEPLYSYAFDFTDRYLVCVKEGTENLYISDYISAMGCELISSTLPGSLFETKHIIYPNPFSFMTTLRVTDRLQNARLSVYNSFGQEVMRLEGISGKEITLYRDYLLAGIYFLRLVQDDTVVVSAKLMITE